MIRKYKYLLSLLLVSVLMTIIGQTSRAEELTHEEVLEEQLCEEEKLNTDGEMDKGSETNFGSELALENEIDIEEKSIELEQLKQGDMANIPDEGESLKGEEEFEKEKELKVDITNANGEKILLKDNSILYTAIPIIFKPRSYEKCIGTYYYSVSLDQGKSFGGYVKMEDESITLYQDEENVPQNDFVLRFKYVYEGVIDSLPYVDGNDAINSDKNVKCAGGDYTPEMEERRELVSTDYHIQFDTDTPSIEIDNPQVLEQWLSDESVLYIKAFDDVSGISRIKVNCEDVVLIDEFCGSDVNDAHGLYAIPLNMESEGEEGRKIDVKVYDKAENMAQVSYTYFLDQTAPQIAIEGVPDRNVSGEGVELSISAIDNCSRRNYVDYVMVKENGETVATEEVHDGEIIYNNTLVISAMEDGYYHITAMVHDLAGNISEEYKYDFRVDTKAPEVHINGANENTDMKEQVDVEINISEVFYEDCNVSITMLREKDNQIINLPVMSFVMEAPIDVRHVTLVNDGDYTIRVEATDALGRSTSTERHFRVDSHAPLISFGNMEDGAVTNTKPVVSVDTLDSFYESTIVDAVLSKKIADDCYSVVDEKKYVMKAKQDCSEFTIDKEGEYRLTCVATDRTGNSESEKIDFTVDYTPPVISKVGDVDGKFLKSFIMPERLGTIVTDITKVNVEAFINNRKAKEGEVILEEGKYTLWIGALDEADNYSEAESTFIIDHTLPQVVIAGVNKNGNVKKGDRIAIWLDDKNDELSEVIFNGRKVQIDSQNNRAEIDIEDYGDYTFEIKARDKAGNELNKTIQTSCVMAKPFTGYSREEKIIHKIPEKIVNYDKNDSDYAGIIIGTIIATVGIAGLATREMLKLKAGL